MPFEVLLSRASSFDELERVEPLLLSSLPEPPASRKQPDGSYWLEHPGGGPWLAVAQEKKSVVFSTSYANVRFVRNFLDSFDLALRLAPSMGARVYETVRGSEVTAANIDALLAANGPFVTNEIAIHRATRERMSAEGLAPLEIPVGPIDLVSEYFVFHLRRPGRAMRGDEVHACLASALGARRVEKGDASGDAFLVSPAETRGFFGRTFGAALGPTTKVLARPDGAVQVWPTWTVPFADLAETTLDVVEALDKGLGAAADHVGVPLDATRRRELRARQTRLGVDVYLWQAR